MGGGEKIISIEELAESISNETPDIGDIGGVSKIQALISTEELATFLGVTVQVIRRMVKEKKIPAYQLDRVFRFDLNEVLESLRVK